MKPTAPNLHKKTSLLRRLAGFTLTEVIVSTGILTMTMGVAVTSLVHVQKNNMALLNYAGMTKEGVYCLEIFGRDARMCTDVISAGSTEFQFFKLLPTEDKITITYRYNAERKELTRDEEGMEEVMLTHLDDFQFRYFNILRQTTTNHLEVKTVQIDAVMRRMILSSSNTDHIVSAQFMMRNRTVAN